LQGLLRGLTRNTRLSWKDQQGFWEMTGPVRGISACCGKLRHLDVGLLDSQVARLNRCNPVLQRLQQAFHIGASPVRVAR
jgi:hypothetical protein